MTRRVLVAVDGSPASRQALSFALDAAPGAEVTVLHVVDPVGAIYATEGMGPGDGMEWYEAARERADDVLAESRRRAADHGVEVRTETVAGRPDRAILAFVDEHDVDHVFVGSHGRSGVDRLVLGSVAEAVVRRAPVPVTVVRGRQSRS